MISVRKIIRKEILSLKTTVLGSKNTVVVNPEYVVNLQQDIQARSDVSNYSPTWKRMIADFKQAIAHADLNNFLQWDIVKETITSENSTLVDKEYDALAKDKNFVQLWKPLLLETGLGNPERFWRNTNFGVNKIHQVYHLMRFHNFAPHAFQNISLVLEFGGGYGNMCQLFSEMQSAQKYFIFDFPEMLALQKFYLKSINISADFEYNKSNYCSLFSDVKKVEDSVLTVTGKKLFIATWSFSESPIELREQFTKTLETFDYLLIAFQDNFDQVTNSSYFKQWTTQFTHMDWELSEITQFKNNFYLFGKRK